MYGPCKLKKCKIVPHFDLPDLLKLKRIQYPCIMDLNEHEIIRALNYADVYEILSDGSELLLHMKNFNKENKPDIPKTEVKGLPGVYTYDIAGMDVAGIGTARLYQ